MPLTSPNAPILWISLLFNLILILGGLWVWQADSHITSTWSRSSPLELFRQYPIDLDNATAVFNTVNGALKQKHANIHPVGVSFIPAYLPPNTLMYHSTGSPELPSLFEWVAMDYEFSYSFAHFPRGKARDDRWPPPKDGPGGPGAPPKQSIANVESDDSLPPPPRPNFPFHGRSFLYTLRNTEPLDKLIYLDGALAAKTNTGEMDQQLLLSRQQDPDQRVNERAAAQRICQWGKPFGLQGVIRLEIGFEIILCDFYDKIELVSNVTLHDTALLGNLPEEPPVAHTDLEKKRMSLMDIWQKMGGIDWLEAGSRVYEGESRILLDFSKLVTPLNKTYIDSDPYKRRINKLPANLNDDIIAQLQSNLKDGVNPYKKTNWQAVTESVANKFAPYLLDLNNTLVLFDYELNSGDLGSAVENATQGITKTLYNFIRRYSDNNNDDWGDNRANFLQLAIADYVHHTYELSSELEVLIFSSVYKVATEVLSTLYDLFGLAREAIPDFYVEPTEEHYHKLRDELLREKEALSQLLAKLAWPKFIGCSKVCGWDEVCYVPSWGPSPFWGSKNHRFLSFDGERFRIPQELTCVGLKDVTA